MVNASGYDAKVERMLDECKISSKLLNYIEHFDYPYVNDVQVYYESLLKIGQGTFGEVFKARCKKTGQLVALKKILMENEKEGFPITALREIKMLKLLRHPNITELIEVCTCKQRNARERFSFYLVFTFCEHDLAGLLSNQKIKFGLVEIKTMAKHILEGLNKIHKSNILHRDMKSANVLITSDGVLKLADFGLARLMIKQPDYRYTNRVVTLWYRPPELLLGSSNYGPSIDVWGAGCIIAELWIRTPILQGNTEQEQLVRITQLCGSISPESWPGCEKLPLYGKLRLDYQQQQNPASNSAITQTFPNLKRRVRERIGPFLEKWAKSQDSTADLDKFAHYLAFTTQQEQALALIDQMLSLCPEQRPSAEEALDHNFFWEEPLAAVNIKELVDKLKGTNLFEYTSGCGAHAHRKQRPVAPAAPGHFATNGPQQQRRQQSAAAASSNMPSQQQIRLSGAAKKQEQPPSNSNASGAAQQMRFSGALQIKQEPSSNYDTGPSATQQMRSTTTAAAVQIKQEPSSNYSTGAGTTQQMRSSAAVQTAIKQEPSSNYGTGTGTTHQVRSSGQIKQEHQSKSIGITSAGSLAKAGTSLASAASIFDNFSSHPQTHDRSSTIAQQQLLDSQSFTGGPHQNRKRPLNSSDDYNNTPPHLATIRRPIPLAQTPSGERHTPSSRSIGGSGAMGGVWQQQQQRSGLATTPNSSAALSQQQALWHSQQQQQQQYSSQQHIGRGGGGGGYPTQSSFNSPSSGQLQQQQRGQQQVWSVAPSSLQPQAQQQQHISSSRTQNQYKSRYPVPQPSYNRQPPPTEHHQQPRYFQ